jgi:hypothetical protein
MLYNQENEIRVIQRRLNLDEPIVEIFSNDARLADLHGFGSETEAVA